MIIKEATDNKAIISSGIDSNTEFSIKNSAKAFHILSTSLYSDTRLAILRELGCNARDSHVAAGQTRPWELSLPTFSEPTLEIEDFGLGLSNSEVMGLFTTFFESTKTDSNEFVGALGLGLKSPFSYTDNFTIVAVKDGVKNVYSAYKTDAGIPAVARLHTESTQQGNGVKISIAIKNKDASSFVSRERQNYSFVSRVPIAYSFFEQKPKITRGANSIAYTVTNPVTLDGTDLGVLQLMPDRYSHSYSNGVGSCVVMGGIQYPIDANRSEFANHKETLKKNNLVFMADIGSVEMTPSREGLTYNAQTVSWILKKLNALNRTISTILEDSLKSINSDWRRAEFLIKNMRDSLSGETATKMHNRLFPGHLSINLTMDEMEQHGVSFRIVHKSSYKNAVVSTLETRSVNLVMNSTTAHSGLRVLFDDKKLLVGEIKSGCNTPSSAVLPTTYIFKGGATAKKWLSEKFASVGLDLEDASTVFKKEPKTVRSKYTHSNITKNGYGYSNAEFRIESSSKPIAGSIKYYVPLFNGKVAINPSSTRVNSVTLQHVWDFIKSEPERVIGLSKSQEENKPEHLINLIDLLQEQFETEIELAKTDRGAMSLAIDLTSRHNYSQINILKFKTCECIDDPILHQILECTNRAPVHFKYPEIAYQKSPLAQKLYKEIIDLFETRYAVLKLDHLQKLDEPTRINLLNLLYKSSITQ